MDDKVKVVIVGNPLSGGITVHGPFTADEAVEWQKQFGKNACIHSLSDKRGNLITRDNIHSWLCSLRYVSLMEISNDRL